MNTFLYAGKTAMGILVLFLLGANVYSQKSFQPTTFTGVKLGMNSSQVTFDPAIKQEAAIGFIGGLLFKHISEKNLGVQLELTLSQLGWKEKLDSGTYFRRLNYIVLPLMTHVTLGKASTNFLLNMGPFLSYLISQKESIQSIGTQSYKDYYTMDAGQPLGVGLCFGVGVSRMTSIGLFQLEARFNQGLNNIISSDYFDASRVQAIEINFSYAFLMK